jgi:phthiocerol/phenolphthiocerol synthesis type-I polyketide synthase C
VVLQSPPDLPDLPDLPDSPAAAVGAGAATPPLLLSGRDRPAVEALAAQMADRVAGLDADAYRALASSAATHRDWLESRVVAFGSDVPAVHAALVAIAAGEETRLAASGEVLPQARGPVFVYSGNGAQWAGMGRQLLRQSKCFADVLAEVDAVFKTFGSFSLVDTLLADDIETRLQATEIAQPLLFAIQVGLTRLMADAGCRPAAVAGHSVGEVAAAWACGALTLHQAVQVIFERSVHQGATRGQGAMTAVGLSEQEVHGLLEELAVVDQVVVAGINSPRGVTLAGSVEALATVEAALNRREIFCRRLALDYAFHSPAMDALEQPLKRDLATLSPAHGDVPFYSTVTGGRLGGARLDTDYWWHNVRKPVLFGDALASLLEDGFNVFVEIGPHAILRSYIHELPAGQVGQRARDPDVATR